MNETIEQRIKKIFAEQLGVAINEVTADDTVETLHGDSLDHVEIIMAVEDDLSVEIPDEKMEELETVQQIVDYVTKVKA